MLALRRLWVAQGLWFTAVLFENAAWFVAANGKGPTGLWAAPNGRHVLVADSKLPGLVLVDLKFGEAVERLNLIDEVGFSKISPTAVASCGDCAVLFLSMTGGNYLVLHLQDTVDNLLRQYGRLGLAETHNKDNETLLSVTLEEYEGDGRVAGDGRSVLMSADGRIVYMADLHGNAIYAIHGFHLPPRDRTKSPRPATFRLANKKSAKTAKQGTLKLVKLHHLDPNVKWPYGVSWASSSSAATSRHHLWVTTHGGIIWKIDATTGKTLQEVNMTTMDCSFSDDGAIPGFRNVVEDPRNTSGYNTTLLVIGNFRRTRDSSLWSVPVGGGRCEILFGGRFMATASGTFWRDGYGTNQIPREKTMLSQSHNIVLHPDVSRPTVILTDIHNRALRLLDLESGTTSSILYDRDRILGLLDPWPQSKRSCEEVRAAANSSAASDVTLFPSTSPLGASSVVRVESAMEKVTIYEAQASCQSQGLRLCEPQELRRAPAMFRNQNDSWWTNAPCAGCYEDETGGSECETFLFHHLPALADTGKSRVFTQYLLELGLNEAWLPFYFWNSGNAVEVAADEGTTFAGSRTMCLGSFGVWASVACCADCAG